VKLQPPAAGNPYRLAGFTLSPAFDPGFQALFVGLVILVLSQVMKEAVQLHDEQRLTI
jgi:hypothetical protein